LDVGGLTSWVETGRETVMVKLLDHTIPMAPEEYETDTFSIILRDLEMSLTKMDFPRKVTGEDDLNGVSWFLG
jgi:hypothetical protein